MGLFETVFAFVERLVQTLPLWQTILLGVTAFLVTTIVLNLLKQKLFVNPNEPPVVTSLFPLIGSTLSYGIDPYKFFFECYEKYGEVFTFVLLGKKVTVCLGTKGNEFVLNGKTKDVNAEEVYSGLCTPVFGSDVVYDCPHSKLMEQKKFMKFGLNTEAFKAYVPLIAAETTNFVEKSSRWMGDSGKVDICPAMAELTIYTASGSLQGREVRDKFDSSFADTYHDLDMGFSPINFMLPWAPLPHNRKRDIAQKKMAQVYMDIVKARREAGGVRKDGEADMIWNLMECVYKNGVAVPDKEIAHMMIALLMAGQHSSSSTSAWIMLRLATRPDIQEELLEEQKRVLGKDLPPLTYDNLQLLSLHSKVVKETLRLHAPIHSILRKVKTPMSIVSQTATTTKNYVIPNTHNVLSAPGFTSRLSQYFPEPSLWEPHRWDEGHSLQYSHAGMEKEEYEDYGYGMISKGASSPYLPFGAGRHRCIGEQFAYVQLSVILATMVRKVKIVNEDGKKGVVNTDYSSLFSRPLGPAIVDFQKR